MTQIFYLRASWCAEEFEEIFRKHQIEPATEDMERVKSLVQWSRREKLLDDKQISSILIDLEGADFGNPHVLSTVQQLRAYSAAAIIFLEREKTESSERLRAALQNQLGVEDFYYKTDPELNQKLVKALTGQTTLLAKTVDIISEAIQETAEERKPYRIGQGKPLLVAVAGSQAHIGATTQTFFVCRLLGSSAKTAILDPNRQMSTLLKGYYAPEMQREGIVQIRGITFCEEISEEQNVFLWDMGVLCTQNVGEFAQADVAVLVVGTKPWELEYTATALKIARQAAVRSLIVVASFTAPETAEGVKPVLGKLYPMECYPDPWSDVIPAAEELKKALLEALRNADI